MSSSYSPLTVALVADRLKAAAEKKLKLLIVCHQNPDGDTVCSSFALKLIYNTLCGDDLAHCVCASDGAPYLHPFYRGQDSIAYVPSEEKDYGIVAAVDVATPKQLGKLQFLMPKIEFMLDHHSTGEAFADYLTVPTAAAAAELIWDLYEHLKSEGFKNDPQIARLIYAAISADTGSFRYSNTTKKTMNIAACLLEEINSATDGGADTAEIARLLHENTTLGELRAQRLAIDNLKFAAGGRLAYIIFTADMLEENGISELDIGGIVDLPRSIEGVEIGITVKQNRADRESFRISSRSNGEADVSRVCATFGGGGHIKAAGATLTAPSVEKAEEIIVSEFSKELNNIGERSKS